MSVKQFTSSDNIKLLWDIVSDEDVFLFLDKNRQASMYELFLNNIKGFYEAEKNKAPNLVEINKKYISLIMTHINKNYNLNKIKIHHDNHYNNINNNNNNNNKELITIEEIQNGRRSNFERDWIQKQKEFEESITLKTPPVPEFADKQLDTPIQDLDKKLKEIQNQRNYDIEQTYHYNNNNNNNNSNNNNSNSNSNSNSWLTPQETSVKEQKKSVSFQDEDISNKEFNIFSKLKFKETTYTEKENKDISLERKVDMLIEKVDAILQILSSKI